MDFRSLVVPAADFDKVVHIVAVKTGKCRDIDAVTLPLLKLVKAVEPRIRLFKVALADKLLIVIVREEG